MKKRKGLIFIIVLILIIFVLCLLGVIFGGWHIDNAKKELIQTKTLEKSNISKIKNNEKVNVFINTTWATDYNQMEGGHFYWLRMKENGSFIIYKDRKKSVGYFDLTNIDDSIDEYEEYELAGMVKHGENFYALVVHEDIDSEEFYKYEVAKIDLDRHGLVILFDVPEANIDTNDMLLPGYFVDDYFYYDIRNRLRSRNRAKTKPVVRKLKKDSPIEKITIDIDEKRFMINEYQKKIEDDQYVVIQKKDGLSIMHKKSSKNKNIKKRNIVSSYLVGDDLFYRVRNKKKYKYCMDICEDPDTFYPNMYFDSLYVYSFSKNKIERLYKA